MYIIIVYYWYGYVYQQHSTHIHVLATDGIPELVCPGLEESVKAHLACSLIDDLKPSQLLMKFAHDWL